MITIALAPIVHYIAGVLGLSCLITAYLVFRRSKQKDAQ